MGTYTRGVGEPSQPNNDSIFVGPSTDELQQLAETASRIGGANLTTGVVEARLRDSGGIDPTLAKELEENRIMLERAREAAKRAISNN